MKTKLMRAVDDQAAASIQTVVESGPRMSIAEYEARAIPRLAAIDRLTEKVDFSNPCWMYTPEGERWQRLMEQQAKDEQAAGL